VRQEWIERAKPLIQAPEEMQVLTGLETWFELPRRSPKSPPKRYKMALLTWLAVFLTLSTMRYLLGSLLAPLPSLLAQLITIGIVVWLLTYVVMPQLTRLFYKWLYPNS
jgi:antibiotic biosynthesis monooxygenase (ABM) superfamily enzyme